MLNTTTTAPSVAGPAGTSSGASGSPSGSAAGAVAAQPRQPPGGQGGGSQAGTDETTRIAAMVDCLRSKGVAVPSPGTDSNGKVVYDATELAKLAQDPKAQAAAQECSAQSPP
ncbi:MAG: hypothetical protein U0U69_06575 [Acidimicrobiia bacterium]